MVQGGGLVASPQRGEQLFRKISLGTYRLTLSTQLGTCRDVELSSRRVLIVQSTLSGCGR